MFESSCGFYGIFFVTIFRWFIVETNYDPWKSPPTCDDRRDAAIRSMNEVGSRNMTSEKLYEVGKSSI